MVEAGMYIAIVVSVALLAGAFTHESKAIVSKIASKNNADAK